MAHSSAISSAGARFAERRAVPRFLLAVDVEILEPIASLNRSGRTSEAGMNGCFVEMPEPFPSRTVIQLRMVRGAESFETWGHVVYAREGKGMGVAFLRVQPDQKAILAKWLAAPDH
jgi:hypothetical protein